jgi:hypothetical protein
MLKAFDAPTREECTAQRPQSNTPLAALTLLNDPTFIEAARGFAERALESDTHSDAERLAWAFSAAVVREPLAAEVDVLQQILTENRAAFRKSPDDAKELLSVGLLQPTVEVDAVEVASWTEVCRAILNLAETNTRN